MNLITIPIAARGSQKGVTWESLASASRTPSVAERRLRSRERGFAEGRSSRYQVGRNDNVDTNTQITSVWEMKLKLEAEKFTPWSSSELRRKNESSSDKRAKTPEDEIQAEGAEREVQLSDVCLVKRDNTQRQSHMTCMDWEEYPRTSLRGLLQKAVGDVKALKRDDAEKDDEGEAS